MLAITFFAAFGLSIGFFFLGLYVAYRLVAWAYKDADKDHTAQYDENSYS